MSNYEKQILATERYYDREMRKIEQSGGEILSSVVPGSDLHQKIHNPVTKGSTRADPSEWKECAGKDRGRRNLHIFLFAGTASGAVLM